MMYEAYGAREYGLLGNNKNGARILKAIKLAYPLKDEQLNSELYALYTDMSNGKYEYILYNLKALEIQRRIGLKYFPYVQNRFFSVSEQLYRTGDYQQSIAYGKEGLDFSNVDVHHWDRRIYIVQMDIIGASYKKLKMYDSAYYYYQKIFDTLKANPFQDAAIQKVWTGIAKGNLGQKFARNKDYVKAMPMMQEYLKNSIEVKDSFNIAIAQNELGRVFFDQNKYKEASVAWKEALQISIIKNFWDQMSAAYDGLSLLYLKKGNVDSVFYYRDKYYQAKETFEEYFRESRYENVTSRLVFDNLQNSFDRIEFDYIRIRNTRNAILAGIVLLTIIVILLYNRKRLKETIRLQEVQQKYKSVQIEADAAKAQIEIFKKNVAEKEKLIEALSLQNGDSGEKKKELEQSLNNFTLVSDDDWQTFRSQFLKAYPAFTVKLRQKLENFSPAEEKLSILIFLQLTNNSLAQTLGISRDSVARSKRRLKSRFCLSNSDSLEDFISGF